MTSVEIPNKSFFNLNEVSSITGIKPYVLRFWETEFSSIIIPVNSETGHKLYEQKDIEAFLLIKKLLFDDKLPIPEAKIKIDEIKGNASAHGAESQVTLPIQVSRQALSEREIQGLQTTKLQLKKMVSELERIKHKFNW